jgi:hypothetical protein
MVQVQYCVVCGHGLDTAGLYTEADLRKAMLAAVHEHRRSLQDDREGAWSIYIEGDAIIKQMKTNARGK